MPFFQKDKSKVKMVGLTGPKEDNITWYSPIWQNQKKSETIVEGMLRRFKNSPQYKSVKVIQFYEKDRLIAEYR